MSLSARREKSKDGFLNEKLVVNEQGFYRFDIFKLEQAIEIIRTRESSLSLVLFFR